MEKAEKFLVKIFYVTMLIFPVSFAIAVSVGYFSDILNTEYIFKPAGIGNVITCRRVLIVLTGLIVYCHSLFEKSDILKNHKIIRSALFLLAVSLIIRVGIFFVFKNSLIPYSDGAHVWEAANFTDSEHRLFKSMEDGWNIFMGLITFFLNHFHVSYKMFMLALFITDGLTALAIYFASYEIFSNTGLAFLRGLLYAVNPDILMRNFHFCGDVITGLFMALALVSFIRLLKEDRLKWILIYAFITGVLLGIGGCFKGISMLFIVAAFIVFVLKILSMGNPGQNMKKVAAYAVSMLLIFFLNRGINRIGLICSSEVVDIECRNLLIWHQIEVGLNPYGVGNLERCRGLYTFSLRYEPWISPEVGRDLMLGILKKNWQESGTKVIPWLAAKARAHWSNGAHNFEKLMINSVDRDIVYHSGFSSAVYNFLLTYCYNSAQLFYIFLLMMTAVGIICVLKSMEDNPGFIMTCLHIFGFSLMMLIVECQPRYKANIMAYFAITAGFGLYNVLSFIKNKLKTNR